MPVSLEKTKLILDRLNEEGFVSKNYNDLLLRKYLENISGFEGEEYNERFIELINRHCIGGFSFSRYLSAKRGISAALDLAKIFDELRQPKPRKATEKKE